MRMKNPEKIEAKYYDILENLSGCLPDGIIDIDLKFLEEANLISNKEEVEANYANNAPKESPSMQFHIMESEDKVTLFNNEFTVWILPANSEKNIQSKTLVVIGQYYDKENSEEVPTISLGFSTTGMYNTSKIILKIAEHFIKKITSADKSLQEISSSTPS